MKRSETVTLAQALSDMLDADPIFHENLLIHKILKTIPNLLDTLNKYILDVNIREDTLYLKVSSGAVRQGLMMERENILRSLNDTIGVELLRNIHIS